MRIVSSASQLGLCVLAVSVLNGSVRVGHAADVEPLPVNFHSVVAAVQNDYAIGTKH